MTKPGNHASFRIELVRVGAQSDYQITKAPPPPKFGNPIQPLFLKDVKDFLKATHPAMIFTQLLGLPLPCHAKTIWKYLFSGWSFCKRDTGFKVTAGCKQGCYSYFCKLLIRNEMTNQKLGFNIR